MTKYMVINDLSDTFDFVIVQKLELGELNPEDETYTVTDSTLVFEFHPDQEASDFGSLAGLHIPKSIADKMLDEDGMKAEVNRVMNMRRSVYMGRLKRAQHGLDEMLACYTIGA